MKNSSVGYYGKRKIEEKAKEFGVPLEWAIKSRTVFLKDRVMELKTHNEILTKRIREVSDKATKKYLLNGVAENNNLIKKHEYQIKAFNSDRKEDITDEDIEQARTSPIENLVEVNCKGFARCVNHLPDNNPSMWCKNNRAKCFSCQWSGSTIDIYMKLHDVDFKKAVKELSQH